MATIERSPVMEGRMMSMIVSRAPGWEPPKKQLPPSTSKNQTQQATSETAPQSIETAETVPQSNETAEVQQQ
jgi:translation initiation factor IF-3